MVPNILQDSERHGAPLGSYREQKKPDKYSGYVANMSHIGDSKHSTYEEVAKK